MSIGSRIKEIRNDQGFTQEQMSSALLVSRSLVGNIESGKATATKRFINNFCQVFGVNEMWLTTGEGEKYRNVTHHVVDPHMKYPVDDVWDTATGYVFKYAHIAKALSDSCNLDDTIWNIFNQSQWVDVFNYIISKFILPGVRNADHGDRFIEQFRKAFPSFDDYIDEKNQENNVERTSKKHMQELKNKSLWNDLEKLTFAVMDDPTVLGIEKSAEIEENVLSHRIYVERTDP